MGNNRQGFTRSWESKAFLKCIAVAFTVKSPTRLSAFLCSAAILSLVQLRALTHSSTRPAVHTHHVLIPLYAHDRTDIFHRSCRRVWGAASSTNLTEYSPLFPTRRRMKNVNNSTTRLLWLLAFRSTIHLQVVTNVECSTVHAWAVSTGCWYQGTYYIMFTISDFSPRKSLTTEASAREDFTTSYT